MIRHRLYVDWDCNTIGPDLGKSVKYDIIYRFIVEYIDRGDALQAQDLIVIRNTYKRL